MYISKRRIRLKTNNINDNKTNSNHSTQTHTHIKKGRSKMKQKILLPVFDVSLLDDETEEYICEQFIDRMVNFAIESMMKDKINQMKPPDRQ